ncbi:MAG: BolA family transcriptional regulator [Candidatus Melainabacteria bacterium]|nr:BolA family transcriptional regulator [Candidatus Melainabacteria bacterium]
MIPITDIESKIKQRIKISHLEVIDLRGGDHIQVILVSPEFEEKSLVEQHKIVYDILANEIKTNEIHALTLKTYSPAQWQKAKPGFKRELGHEI